MLARQDQPLPDGVSQIEFQPSSTTMPPSRRPEKCPPISPRRVDRSRRHPMDHHRHDFTKRINREPVGRRSSATVFHPRGALSLVGSPADEDEIGPGFDVLVRCGDRLELGGAEGGSGITAALGEPVMLEALHEGAGALVTHRPEGDHHVSRAGGTEGADQSRDTLGMIGLPLRCFAGRERTTSSVPSRFSPCASMASRTPSSPALRSARLAPANAIPASSIGRCGRDRKRPV